LPCHDVLALAGAAALRAGLRVGDIDLDVAFAEASRANAWLVDLPGSVAFFATVVFLGVDLALAGPVADVAGVCEYGCAHRDKCE